MSNFFSAIFFIGSLTSLAFVFSSILVDKKDFAYAFSLTARQRLNEINNIKQI
jgi:hypothetical protein